MSESLISIGVAGAIGPEAIARVAEAAEAAGFDALWVNDTPDGDSLAGLAAAARVTEHLTLATGVIPVDRRGPQAILPALRELPMERLILGIGSGKVREGALDLVQTAIARLREAEPSRILVGALGPKMRAVAAGDADGPLLSWLDPENAHKEAQEAQLLNSAAHVALYVRAALHDDALAPLEKETATYAGYPNYARNLARLGISGADTVIPPDTLGKRLPEYRRAVDEVVLRAITPHGNADELVDFVHAVSDMIELHRP